MDPADIERQRKLEPDNVKLKRVLARREMAMDTLNWINRRKS
jgi:hypothetical protein